MKKSTIIWIIAIIVILIIIGILIFLAFKYLPQFQEIVTGVPVPSSGSASGSSLA